MQSRKLPIGIQSFETIRTEGYIYIDKTPWIARMATQGKPYFLSHPRRFGKSLLVNTMEIAFSGRRELFVGKPTAWGPGGGADRRIRQAHPGCFARSLPALRLPDRGLHLWQGGKFSKAGVFSGLNQLKDLTLDANCAAVCGYTQEDMDHLFAPLVTTYFASLGLTVIPEDVTNRGRIDLTVIGPKGILIFEFKVQGVDRSGDAAPLG
jgi:hypothetical protein